MLTDTGEVKPNQDVSFYLKALYCVFALPLIIFVIGYYPLTIALPTLSLIIVLFAYVLKVERIKEEQEIRIFERGAVCISLLLAILLSLVSGASRLFSTSLNWDWAKHDSILNDLVLLDWPVIYSWTEQGVDVLVYSSSYYFFPAVLAHSLALNAHILLVIQTIVFLFLLFRTLSLQITQSQLIFLASLLFISPLSSISQPLSVLIFIPTQHALAILFALVLLIDVHQNRRLNYAIASIPALFLFSPFTAFTLGLLVIGFWCFNMDYRDRTVYFLGGASLVLLGVIFLWFGIASSNQLAFYNNASDDWRNEWFAFHLVPLAYLYFFTKENKAFIGAIFLTLIIVFFIDIGSSDDLHRIGGALLTLITVYLLIDAVSKKVRFKPIVFIFLGVGVFVGVYKLVSSTKSPFYNPTVWNGGSLSVNAAIHRFPYRQYIQTLEEGSYLLGSAESTYSENLVSQELRKQTHTLNSTISEATLYPRELSAGVYKLVLELHMPKEPNNTGFTIIRDLESEPLLIMPNRNLNFYTSGQILLNNSIKLPLYIKLGGGVEQLSITTKSVKRYHHKSYQDTEAEFKFNIIGLYKVG